jgi:glycosyltransferase involved in cell wall biosynthesis
MHRTGVGPATDHGAFDRRGRRRDDTRGRRGYDRVDHPRPDAPSVSVIIPTLNEARNLLQVLPRIPEWVLEVLVIDGSSSDDTVRVAREHGTNVRVVFTSERGKGAALRVGFQEARGDVIVALDADGSTDPAEIVGFVGLLASGADVVLGSRFAVGGGTTDMEPHRRAGNWVLTKLVRIAFGTGFSDLCYGYFAFWRDVLPCLDGPFTGFEVETMIHIRAARADLRIDEVPSFESPRIWGSSNLRTFRDGWRVLKAIFAEWRRNRAGARIEPSPLPDERHHPTAPPNLRVVTDESDTDARAAQ